MWDGALLSKREFVRFRFLEFALVKQLINCSLDGCRIGVVARDGLHNVGAADRRPLDPVVRVVLDDAADAVTVIGHTRAYEPQNRVSIG